MARRPAFLVPFQRPTCSADALAAIAATLQSGRLQGGGWRTSACHDLLREAIGSGTPFLTTSGTHALEMAALILDLGPGDEVVMPSWTFPSTASAVALRGATPVFVDVEARTLNIDPVHVERALTPRTRAVFCVHYAGIGCEMEALGALCATAGIALVEDAAQGLGAEWNGRPLGSFGDLAALSFHGTKNVSCGEGGALIVNAASLLPRAEIAWEKGTDRLRFERGQVEQYEWCDLGSSFLPSEVTAALLETQLKEAGPILHLRRAAWQRYVDLLDRSGLVPLLLMPGVPEAACGNGHIFAVRFGGIAERDRVQGILRERGIDARTHYRPLHLSKAGRRFGRTSGPMANTEAAADGLLRLPLDATITPAEQEHVVDALGIALRDRGRTAA